MVRLPQGGRDAPGDGFLFSEIRHRVGARAIAYGQFRLRPKNFLSAPRGGEVGVRSTPGEVGDVHPKTQSATTCWLIWRVSFKPLCLSSTAPSSPSPSPPPGAEREPSCDFIHMQFPWGRRFAPWYVYHKVGATPRVTDFSSVKQINISDPCYKPLYATTANQKRRGIAPPFSLSLRLSFYG